MRRSLMALCVALMLLIGVAASASASFYTTTTFYQSYQWWYPMNSADHYCHDLGFRTAHPGVSVTVVTRATHETPGTLKIVCRD